MLLFRTCKPFRPDYLFRIKHGFILKIFMIGKVLALSCVMCKAFVPYKI